MHVANILNNYQTLGKRLLAIRVEELKNIAETNCQISQITHVRSCEPWFVDKTRH